MNKIEIIELEKGGMIVETSIGDIQFGVPPETIKDSLELGRDVPTIYLAPKNLFSFKRMASFIDIEFPIYYNFFIKKRKITVICTEEQKNIIQGVMEESLFGPQNLNIEYEYIGGKSNPFYPNLKKEMRFFSKHPIEDRETTLNDLMSFFILSENKKEIYNGVTFLLDTVSDLVNISYNDKSIILPYNLDYQITRQNLKMKNVFYHHLLVLQLWDLLMGLILRAKQVVLSFGSMVVV